MASIFVVEFQHRHHRPKDFLAGDAHAVGDIGEDRRLDEEPAFKTLQRRNAAAVMEGCSLGLADGDVAGHLLVLRFVDERTHLGLGIERIADADGLGALGQPVDEAIVEPVLDENPCAVGTDLAGGVEVGEQRAANRIFDIGVVENDQRRFPAKLHRGVLHQRPGERQHFLAGRHGAGQRDLCDDLVRSQRAADIAIALHDIEEPVRQAGLGVDFSQRKRRERRVLGRLEHHGVAHGECGGRLPARALDRVVPGADADADAESLPARVGKGAAEIDVIAVIACDRAAEEFKRIGRRCRVGDQRFLNGLAGVERLQACELGIAGAQDVGGAAKNAPALDRLQPRPDGLRFPRRLDGKLDDVLGGGMQHGDGLAGRRIDDRNDRAALVVDEAAVDVVRCLRLRAHENVSASCRAWPFPESHATSLARSIYRSETCQRGLIQGS